MEDAGKIAAIGRAQAVIEFNLDGTIITANDNFLAAVGYSLAEIQGKHHSMFVAPGERDSAAYREFWASLNRGEFQSAEYKRFGKGGKEVWILASYNPILDDTGKPFKVVKFASDVSAQKLKAANFAGPDRGDRQVAGGDRVRHGRQGADREREFPRRARLFARRDPGQASQHVRAAGRARQRGLSRVLGQPEPRRIPVGRISARRQGRQGDLDPGLLQSDPRPQRQAVQGGEIRHRHHRAGDRADAERKGARHDGIGRGRRRGIERLGPRNLRSDGEVEGNRADGGRPGRGRRSAGAASAARRRNR